MKKEDRKIKNRRKLQALNRQNLPKLVVFRSLTNIYAQIIDVNGKVLAQASSLKIKEGSKSEQAEKVGQLIGQMALKNKVRQVIFDRRDYRYHGRVKILAEAVKKEGLKI